MEVFNALHSDFCIKNIWAHEETGHIWSYKRDKVVRNWCRSMGVGLMEFPSNSVVRGLKDRGDWQTIRQTRLKKPLIPAPERLRGIPELVPGQIPSKDNKIFGAPLNNRVQVGGRKAALDIIYSFTSMRGRNYLKHISSPHQSFDSCSRLSPHLALGTVSVKEVIALIKNLTSNSQYKMNITKRNSEAFLSRLAWRCHFIQKLEDMPDLELKCMHQHFEGIRDGHNDKWLNAWKLGKTGYPYIDACMRSLICEGWLNFRARASLVSFASYHLWLDWRETGNYLASLFTDFEPGIHFSQMQMQSGVTGINTIRIYNPIIQSKQNDPSGYFIKKWIPELKGIKNCYIHEPWLIKKANKYISSKVIGTEYTSPIINHALEYKKAKHKLSLIDKNDEFRFLAHKVYKTLGSRSGMRLGKTRHRRDYNKRQLSFEF